MVGSLQPDFYPHSVPALLEVLDLSKNQFTGLIPTELNNVQFASVYLTENGNM